MYVAPGFAGDGGVDRNVSPCTILDTVIVCVTEPANQLESPARVTSTTQEIPPRAAEREEPDNVHEPEFTDHERAPVDWPPDATNDNGVPVVNDDALVTDNPDCVPLPIVTVVFAESFAE